MSTNHSETLERLLERTSRTFALSIPVLPQPTRREVTVAYLLFRIADTLEDATRWGRERKLAELAALEACLQAPSADRARGLASEWLSEPPCAHGGYLELLRETPRVLAAVEALSPPARELVLAHTVRTVRRMAGFVRQSGEGDGLQLEDTDELRSYCYAVAGIVGEMLTELFLLGREGLQPIAADLRERAATFGEALQLVNILRDSRDDAVEGRRYLPAGCDRDEVFALARCDLEVAGEYVRLLQDSGAPRGVVEFTALPVLLAWRTLDAVQERGPGAKVGRVAVLALVRRLGKALDAGRPAVPRGPGST